MANDTTTEETRDHAAPPAAESHHQLSLGDTVVDYRAYADWIVLREREQPIAEMFHVFYQVACDAPAARPVTFVFNGGPGAAAAYLHLGGLGPKRVRFNGDGTAPAPPAVLEDNPESWLAFTDLVFIDPIGTGFSRVIDKAKDEARSKGQDGRAAAAGDGPSGRPKGLSPEEREFYQLERDLDSLVEFIERFLSKRGRWGSPIFIAGESYGGFRVAKLARRLQETRGIGLNGAILISPALEWYFLASSDYDILFWANVFPSLALTAAFHGKSSAFAPGASPDDIRAQAEAFASTELVLYLAQGDAMDSARRQAIHERMATMLGVPVEYVARRRGRVGPLEFARELLRDQRLFCGLYDSTITAVDPFPARDTFEGPDPTLFAIARLFAAAANMQLRDVLGVSSERDYHLLSLAVNAAWKLDSGQHALDTYVGSADDLRFAMSLNPHMKVFLTHGLYDLITPYYAAERIKNHLALDANLAANLVVQYFGGGHMFYTWDESRRAFTRAMAEFYGAACAAR